MVRCPGVFFPFNLCQKSAVNSTWRFCISCALKPQCSPCRTLWRCIEPYVSHGWTRTSVDFRAADTRTTCSFLVKVVWVSSLHSLPHLTSIFFVRSVIQGHYVMLMRAPHLEKCHWDAGIVELTSGPENSCVPVEDISSSGRWSEKFAAHQLHKTVISLDQ